MRSVADSRTREDIAGSRADLSARRPLCKRALAWLRCCSIGNSYLIETQGRMCAIWKVGMGKWRPTDAFTRIANEEAAIREELRGLGYLGQPATVILHPPVVAVKLFAIGAESPEEWLAAHLTEISPPGNRRELALAYHAAKAGELVTVFARKSEVHRLLTTLQCAGIAIDSLVPAAQLVLAETEKPAETSRDVVRFMLCQYRVGGEGQFQTLQVESPEESSDREALRNSAATLRRYAIRVHEESSKRHGRFSRLDFRPQFGLPRALPTRYLLRATRLMGCLLLALVTVVIGLWATQMLSGEAEEDSLLREIYRARDEIQAENARLEGSIERIAGMRSVRADLPRLFSAISRAVPAHCWLGSLQLRSEAEGEEVVFTLSGYSRDEDAPQVLAAALRQSPGFAAVTLERVSRAEASVDTEKGALTHAAVFRFEVTGRFNDAE